MNASERNLHQATFTPLLGRHLLWASANFDEEIFDDPTQLDFRRNNNRHLSFGRGIHRCSGAHLARLEMMIMLQQLLHRLPDYVIDETALHLHRDVGLVYGFGSVPMRFNAPAVAAFHDA